MKTFFNQLFRLFLLLIVLIFLFAAGRTILYFANSELFNSFGFSAVFFAILKGLKYDFLVVVFVNSLFVFLFFWPAKIYNSGFYQFSLKFLFFLLNALALFINLFDVRMYKLSGHRLRAFELIEEVNLYLEEMKNTQFNDLIDRYLHLAVYFLVILVILVLCFKLIKRIDTEYKHKKRIRKWSGFAILLTIAFLFVLNNFRKEDLYGNLYLKADRKLAPLVVNNPYLLLTTVKAKKMEPITNWELNEFSSIKKYEKEKMPAFDRIKLIVIEQKEYSGNNQEQNFFPLSTLDNYSQNIFQLLDEVLLSFPGVYRNGFYHSIYSLNKFESLLNLLKKENFVTKLKVVGYPKEVEKLIKNFYSFDVSDEVESTAGMKIFELLVINARIDESNMHAASLEMVNDNELIIRINAGFEKQGSPNSSLERTISFTSLKELPFYSKIDSIIAQPLDIKPTLLHLLGYDDYFTTYGSSLFANDEKVQFQCVSDSSLRLLADSLLLSYSNNETIELRKLRNYQFSASDFKDSLAVERILLENKIQSIINNFKQRLKNNSL
jgi:hypothetical protein